jgi:NAD(P)H-hydrate epimerase
MAASAPSKKLRLTREQCRAVDRHAIEQLGIAGVVLMENAGRNAADLIERWARPATGKRASEEPGRSLRFAILCGKGNNGGDGFVIARHLFNRGHIVEVSLVSDATSLTGDAAANYQIATRLGIPVHICCEAVSLNEAAAHWRACDVLVDAILGTGFRGPLRDPLMAGVIERINAARVSLVVAVDLPSGVDADLGLTGSPTVRADRTITFVAEKVSFAHSEVKARLGQVKVVDIGVPAGWILERLGDQGAGHQSE